MIKSFGSSWDSRIAPMNIYKWEQLGEGKDKQLFDPDKDTYLLGKEAGVVYFMEVGYRGRKR